ncbi:malonyl CoA-acyl carrier protein transacylase [Microthyrium microscopicum]|uniref:[acyl-carrier-protein] S-malonyltransferase n=1 Tax=Microthyrium microscopicum TaxID=703497 RepID=A0A6A6UKH4_9PEZI|nr:malonyl CoA-acyl carrier protein transacylase [Microthyrium microscopicum]
MSSLAARLPASSLLPATRYAARYSSGPPSKRPKTAIFFPGHGVQRVGMIEPWLKAYPRTVKPMLEEVDDVLRMPLSRIIAEGPNASLNATENSQPAIMATSYIILRVLENEFGFRTEQRVDFTLGHSLGEFAALVAGGYLNFQDALKMVRKRGEVMASATKLATETTGGAMGMVALVTEDENRLRALVKGIYEFIGLSTEGSKYNSSEDVPGVQQVFIANINSKNQIVLAGSIEKINTLLTNLRQFGGHDPRAVRLSSESPFHSLMMRPAQDFMKRILMTPSSITNEDIVNFPARLPCISNVTARPFKSRADLKDLLARQCTETVRWWESVRYLDQEEQVQRWIGIGPGKVGRNLVGKEVGMKGQVKGGGVWGITSPQEAEECIRALDETEEYADHHA